MNKTIDKRSSRAYTKAILELVEEGALGKDNLIRNLLNWMSEADVAEFADRNLSDFFDNDDIEEEEEELEEEEENDEATELS